MWKKIIFAGIIIFTAVLSMCFYISMQFIDNSKEKIFYEIIDENTKANVSPLLGIEKEVGGFKISQINLTQVGQEVTVTANVTNISGKDTTDFTYFTITFINGNHEVIDSIPGIIDPLANGATATLNSSIQGLVDDFINAYDINFEIRTQESMIIQQSEQVEQTE